ncbi:hypothetical protein BPUN_2827 [Candidatus Paraburkholderia kirkii]|nr:hypothetical protein BPUN_2827 [Candidatus Paraburkholderia kirkii]
MKTWLALLGAPLIVLGCLSVNYALVAPACGLGSRALLDSVSGASVVVCTLALPTPDGADRPARAGFVAAVAAGVGALSVLSVIAISIPQWLLPAC